MTRFDRHLKDLRKTEENAADYRATGACSFFEYNLLKEGLSSLNP
jgi:hypothetical protein